MKLPRIVAVTAPCRRSGKGTVADVLTSEFGYVQFNYALVLKTAFVALCLYQGIERERIDRMMAGDLKETPQPEIGGLSLRSFCEGIGTDWGRNMVREDLWTDMARPKIEKLLADGHRVVIEDARFANECDIVKQMGGKVVRVVRPVYNGGLRPTLSSEGHLESYPCDMVFCNDASVERLQTKVRDWIIDAGSQLGLFERVK